MLKKANNMPSRLCIAAINEENNKHNPFFDFASLRSRRSME